MAASLEFLALYVSNLQQAEAYYCELFEMEVITREAPQSDGNWYALPADKNWSDVEQAGIKLFMLALRRDDFVLALFQGKPAVGQIFAVGLSMSVEEMEAVKGRVPADDVVQYEAGQMLHFRDAYKNVWQIYTTPYRFRGTGEAAGHWLDLG